MLASTYGQECNIQTLDEYNMTPEDQRFTCGNAVAIPYFISFYMFCAFLVSCDWTNVIDFTSNFCLKEISLAFETKLNLKQRFLTSRIGFRSRKKLRVFLKLASKRSSAEELTAKKELTWIRNCVPC